MPLQCVNCYAPLRRVCGMPSEATLICTGCGMLYYSESWVEDDLNDDEIDAQLRSYNQRIKARRMQQIDKALAAYKGQACCPTVPSKGLSCKISGG